MLKTKTSLLIATAIFVVAEIFLGYFIQKTSGIEYGILTVSSIFCAWLYVFTNFRRNYIFVLTFIALIFTIFADLFLSGLFYLENSQVLAMCFFCVVQACYFLRIYFNHERLKAKIIHVVVRCVASIVSIVLTILVLKDKTNFLALISIFYFSNLFINLIFAFIQIKKSILFPMGLLFFACCDFFVGLSVLASDFLILEQGSILYFLNNLGVNMAWVFYVPAQTLLALSVNEKSFFKA